MKITKLAPSTKVKGRWLVYLENGDLLRVSENEVADFSLYVGAELPEAALEQLRQAAGETGAKRRAANLLSLRPMSRQELVKKLVDKGEAPHHAQSAADHMERLGYLNDREYAHQVVRHYSQKSYGPRKLRDELYRRGVPRDYWDEALAETDDPAAALDTFVQAKLRGVEEPDRKDLKRVSDALARRGYAWSDISAALRRHGAAAED